MGRSHLVTPAFRVNWPWLFKPRENTLSKKMEYSVQAIFKKGEDLSALKKAAEEACVAEWGPNKNVWPKNLKSPFKNQSTLEKTLEDGSTVMPEGYVKDAVFIQFKTSFNQPTIVDQKVQPILIPSEIYAGCWAKAQVSCYTYANSGNNGVAFGLEMIQKVKDDTTLSGRPKPEECFTPVASGEAEEESDSSEASSPFDV